MKPLKLLLLFIFFIFFANAQVYDYEGNQYDTVKIGKQVWLKQNIKSLHYSDCTPITSGVYAYDDDSSIARIYGYLYSYKTLRRNDTLSNLVQGICPESFHVPTKTEWEALIKYIGGTPVGPAPMTKYTGAENLKDDNMWNGLNTLGFSLLPGGYKEKTLISDYIGFGYETMLWSSDNITPSYRLDSNEYIQPVGFNPLYNPYQFYSCRCIKNGTTSGIE